jgi:apolipoprotein N-acyltransferase
VDDVNLPNLKGRWPLRVFEAGVLAGLLYVCYGIPYASGHGWLEALLCFLIPALMMDGAFKGRRLGWTLLAWVIGLVLIFHWVPNVIEVKGNLPKGVAWLGSGLFFGYEALGFTAVIAFARWMFRRSGRWGAAAGAAFATLLWEAKGFHVYEWSWGSGLGGLPLLARSAAFLTSYGFSALAFGCGAFFAGSLAEGRKLRSILAAPAAFYGSLLAFGLAWSYLPRAPKRELDVVMVQPNFEAGLRRPGMEADAWVLSDAALQEAGLPRPGMATLLLWPESSILGVDHRGPDPRLQEEARRRGLAWLFGTEGGLLNLVRGEADGRPSFVQAKVEPMPFGERMPGPPAIRKWLDRKLGFLSQEPGALTAASTFEMTTPQGSLRIHPLICSEALSAARAQAGVALGGAQLLTNHTNDGWFDRTVATDLHFNQIRLRAVEQGVPMLRSTLTGKSGLSRADGTWELWGEPMSRATHAFHLAWEPVYTPARKKGAALFWFVLSGILTLAFALRPFQPESDLANGDEEAEA